MSSSKKKEKLDLSKLTPMEALLIGESQSFSSQPCSSKSLKATSQRSFSRDVEEVETMEDEDDDSDDSSEEESSESESDDWEVVDDQHVEAEIARRIGDEKGNGALEGTTQSQIPENGLEIVVPQEGVFIRKKKRTGWDEMLRREMNRDRMEFQEILHKTSLIYQLARGLQLNKAVSSEVLRPVIKESIWKEKFTAKRVNLSLIERFIKWFRTKAVLTKPSMKEALETLMTTLSDEEFLAYQIMEQTAVNGDYCVLIFVAFLRYLNIDARLVISLNPISIKTPTSDLIKKPPEDENENDTEMKKNKKQSPRKKKEKNSKKKEKEKNSKKKNYKISSQSKNSGRKMISSSEEESSDEKSKRKKKTKNVPVTIGQDMWTEVYITEEERWISVDILSGKVVCDKQLEAAATSPITYVLGFDSDNKIKDVTRRYASGWLTETHKLRVQEKWWDKTLRPYKGKRTAKDKEEDEFLDQHLASQPIPSTMSGIKSHPLYVLRRHLLKYEGLYPEEPPSVGFIKGEPIFARDYVHILHTRELWMRQAKVVRIGEEPYKKVKARPKYDRSTGVRMPDTISELFGEWQTEDYIPPIAQNGKVPRNEWGNVELFTEKLLPQGCVHLKLPGLQRVAKKLDIDCAPAVVGFDFGCGGSRPAFDGFIVCEEFEETLVDAWNQEQDEKKKRDEEKRLQRIYKNWRKLVRGVLIRDRLEKKYKVNLSGKRKTDSESAGSSKKTRKK